VSLIWDASVRRLDRLEALESRVSRLDNSATDVARRLDFHSAHEKTQSERVEKNCKETIDVLRSDIQFLRVQNSILGAQLRQQQKDPPPMQIIREVQFRS
jgi:hypothetical protein